MPDSLWPCAQSAARFARRFGRIVQKFEWIRSRRLAVVEIEHSTKSLAAPHDSVMVNNGHMPLDQSIAQPVGGEFLNSSPNGPCRAVLRRLAGGVKFFSDRQRTRLNSRHPHTSY